MRSLPTVQEHSELVSAVSEALERARRELRPVKLVRDQRRRYWVLPSRTRGWQGVELVGTARPPNTETKAGESVRGASAVVHERACNPKLSPQLVEPVGNRYRTTPLGPYALATYGSIKTTCPPSCTFYGQSGGCFAASGFIGAIVRKLDEQSRGMTTREAAREQAGLIDLTFGGGSVPRDGACGGRDLRIHVSGDARTPQAVEELRAAAARFRLRGGGTVWTYTHGWHDVPRESWGRIEVLASVETPRHGEAALELDYAPAITVPTFPSKRAFKLSGSGIKWIPCPFEAKADGPTCVECRLCFDTERLKSKRMGIAFAVHGVAKKEAKRRLTVLNGG